MKKKKTLGFEICLTQCCDEPKAIIRRTYKDDIFTKAVPHFPRILMKKKHSLIDQLNLIFDFSGRSYTLYCKQQKKNQEIKQTITDVAN